MIGLKFGKLTVVGPKEIQGNRIYWNCQCDCGNTKMIDGKPMRKGSVTSCGCKVNRVRQALPQKEKKVRQTEKSKPKPKAEPKPKPEPETTSKNAMVMLAYAMRKSGAKWSDVAECCGEELTKAIREGTYEA